VAARHYRQDHVDHEEAACNLLGHREWVVAGDLKYGHDNVEELQVLGNLQPHSEVGLRVPVLVGAVVVHVEHGPRVWQQS